MEIQAKITSRGQITLPRAIREALHVTTGDTVVFELNNASVRLRSHSPRTVQSFVGASRAAQGKTLEEIVSELHVQQDRA